MLILLFFALSVSIVSKCSTGQKVLYLVDTPNSAYSSHIKTLRDYGYEVSVRSVKDNQLRLDSYGQYLYDHIVIAAPKTAEFGGKITVDAILQFLNDETQRRGLFMTLGDEIGSEIESLCLRLGLRVNSEGPKNVVVDYFENKDSVPSVVTLRGSRNILTDIPKHLEDAELIYPRGTCMTTSSSDLANDYLVGNPTSFFSRDQFGQSNITLAARIQARGNNARIFVLGSTEMISDSYFTKSDNSRFLMYALDWAFMNVGNLRVRSVEHRLIDSNQDPLRSSGENASYYIIKDKVEYSISVDLIERDQRSLKVVETPFCSDDMLLEVVRLDPFIRTKLSCENGRFYAQITLPDTYGVFKFLVDYQNPKYTRIHTSTLIPIRPLRHDQYRRFIPCAFPYYATCLSLLIATVLLGIPLLHRKDVRADQNLKMD